MSKNLLLVIWPYKYRDFDWYRHDFHNVEKEYNADVKIHEQLNFLYPHFKKAYANSFKDHRLTSYNSYKKWKEDFRDIIKKTRSKILIINYSRPNNLLGFLVNLELKRAKVKVLEFSSREHPSPPISLNLLFSLKKFVSFIKNIKTFLYFIKSNFFIFLSSIYKLSPTHSMKSGSETFPQHYYKKKINIIEGNSQDYDMYLSIKKNKKNLFNNRYGLFLEAPTPLFDGDNLLINRKKSEFGTVEKWFPSLNYFFDNLENLLNTKIKIAPHPKVKHEKFPQYYGGREVINQKLVEAAAFADVLISRDSGGLSFGALYKKPTILIYSKELIKNIKFIREQKHFAQELGTVAVNIDDHFDNKKIMQLMNFNEEKYIEYKLKYLSTRKDEKRNYQIIGDLLTSK